MKEVLKLNAKRVRKHGKIMRLGKCGFDTEIHSQGVEYEVDLQESSAWDGMPWSSGRIRLEQNPDLQPLIARGYGNDPGVFYELLNTPVVETAIEQMVGAVQGAPIGLDRGKIPEWEQTPENAIRETQQWEYAQRVWREWTAPENEYGLNEWIEDVLRTAPLFGFALFEVMAEPRLWQLTGDDEPRVYWVPSLPLWRAPWSVDRWIQQADNIVGVVLRCSQQSNSEGEVGPMRAALNADKMLLITARRMGKNPEGRSHLRSSVQSIKMLRSDTSLESRARQVNGLGTLVLKEGPEGSDIERLQEIKDHLSSYEARHVPWFILPEGWDVNMISPATATSDFTSSINRNKLDVAMALSAEDRFIGVMKHGSFAARDTASADAWRPYTSIATDYIARPLTRFMARFIQANFCDGPTYSPLVKYSRVEKLDIKTIAEIAAKTGLATDPDVVALIKRSLGV